ncbi:MAG: helix-turn-helix domain-containing protein [Clostridia bacterium]|nr:helix-turn-helix domain-containing protein [Clostridia bacterium]
MLNERIRELRKRKGFTQEELAVRLHVVRQTVSKWEKGVSVPDASTLQSVAEVLEVSVQELLGADAKQPESQNEIAAQLSRINEQMAVRNRRSVIIWKTVSIVLAVALIFSAAWLVLRLQTANQQENRQESVMLPDTVELSDIHIDGDKNRLVCSFVPSIGNLDLEYSVTLSCHATDVPDKTADAEYRNGICTAVFENADLFEYIDYSIVLSIRDGKETRNTVVVTSMSVERDGFSWSSPWN